jgi:trehalose/maltose hydrolase-like predicted phosphorylase
MEAIVSIKTRNTEYNYWVQSTKKELEGKLGTTFSLSNGMLGLRGLMRNARNGDDLSFIWRAIMLKGQALFWDSTMLIIYSVIPTE